MSIGDLAGGAPSAGAWEHSGGRRRLAGLDVFTIEIDAIGDELSEPLLVIHGYPTCSYDFRHVVGRLSLDRRVLLLDLPGFGLSEKPDIRYSIELHADVVAAYAAELGFGRLAMLTHDMGDTVGGELLARQTEGRWPVEVTRRILTNGSIYLELAHLTAGQQMLLSLPDEKLKEGIGRDSLAAALAATMAEGSTTARADARADAELICRREGDALLARTIRYIEDRRRAEDRYTGAIEAYPSPLGVIWGADDPIAVSEMTVRLKQRRSDADVSVLAGVGHYPMLEAPEAFAEAAVRMLAV
jgi:pimeloyl-ACP methyl ester carboxylesterase